MRLVVGHLQVAGIGQDDARVVESAADVVNHHVEQRPGLGILAFDIQVVARNLVVEHPLGNLDLRRFLTHGIKEGPHLRLRDRQHIVLEEERADRHQGDEHNQRPHDLHQRHPGGLHRRKLEPLAEVTECHQRREQNRERERHRDHRQRGVEEQLAEHVDFKPLPHEVVDIAPEELHQHDEQAYEKRHKEQRQEAAQHKPV